MVTEGSVKMAPAALSNGGGNFDEEDIEARFGKGIEVLLTDQQLHRALDRERDLNIYRSGSAPPTVEGSRTAVGFLFGNVGALESGGHTAEEMHSHPNYLSYQPSKNMNPRLPHPTAEEMHSHPNYLSYQPSKNMNPRLPHPTAPPSYGGIGDRRREEPGAGRDSWNSLFSVQPGLPAYDGDRYSGERTRGALQSQPQPTPAEWLEQGTDGLIGLPSAKITTRSKSFTDALQMTHLYNHMGTVDGMHSLATSSGHVRVQSLGPTMPHSVANTLDSVEPQLISRSSSPCLPPTVGRVCEADTAIAFSGLKLTDKLIEDGHNHTLGRFQQDFVDQRKLLLSMPSDESQYIRRNTYHKAETESYVPSIPSQTYDVGLSTPTSNRQINLPRQFYLHKESAAGTTSLARCSSGRYQTDTDVDIPGCNSSVYSASQRLPAMLSSQFDAGVVEGQYFNKTPNQVGSGFVVPTMDQLYAQRRQRSSDFGQQSPASIRDPSLERNYINTSLADFQYQEECIEAFIAHQKLHYDASLSGKYAGFNNGLNDNPALGIGMLYPGSPLHGGSVLSSLGPGSRLRQNDRLAHFSPILRSAAGGSKTSLNVDDGTMQGDYISPLLEELKNNKTRLFELSEIVGHVVEFSADQYGSRFIQQKLEFASVEEKNYIFPEVLPHALILMTDVFGNYVIQKFFEHGTESQRNQLADQLMGYVLPLSLQMYGCRVIQKALEVVDVGQQTQMVSELDGSIMKCVRDQNGNHVIQKCIECVPQERIQFIISSFYGQVVALASHPYGCRVIQRVLEHCVDAKTQNIMIDEIMQSVSTLAQDQYGNYVLQHVLQHGKQEERSAIIRKLAGQIVKMSQQKFASNVVEKCLTYATLEERQLLINEMLGSTDENEPLQAMMKDQFGNYVVQKVLEICDDQNRELILSRIKVHVSALKKYTYGKHIVARVEKLITTGERRIAISPNPTV